MYMPIRDLSNLRFGRLTALSYKRIPTNRGSIVTVWTCRCDCGTICDKRATCLTSGYTQSCGCLHREGVRLMGLSNTRHGYSRTRTWRIWFTMRRRCSDTTHDSYAYYGGRGITVCERWRNSFDNFLADMGECPKGKSIDRYPNKNGNYEPGNCRWATPQEQRNNRNPVTQPRSDAVLYSYKSESLSIGQWANRTGISYSVIKGRLRLGWPLSQALGLVCRSRHS